MLSIESALKTILISTNVLGIERIDLLSSLGRVLAEDIYAYDYLPPFDKSAMDGYALKSSDTLNASKENPIELTVRGSIKAGDDFKKEIETGQTYKVMTGAPIPLGADAVIEIEKVDIKDKKIIINRPVKSNNNIINKGEEVSFGELALPKGKIIRPPEIGFLASLGQEYIPVYNLPKVALIITGNELINIDKKLQPGKIRNSNEYSLKALLESIGIKSVLSFGIIPDDKEVIIQKIKEALAEVDVLISSGGVSVGDYDFIDEILNKIGFKIHFTSVSIKPGKPITFATYEDKLFFGLPGNPASIITTFEEFVKPALKKMKGEVDVLPKKISIVLGEDIKAKTERRKYIYVKIEKKSDKYYAYNAGSQSSSQLKTMTRANGIIIMPEEKNIVKKGEMLEGRFIFN
ncbi:molybdopterin molybdotransferase MoeA [Aceticella autotrophica]|uniref:Molybdopterin molybdenumtransferase n=1 Tax=Aceticella autotrophica TaxID=2755338 RepID=A0A975AUX1_9THEO|nr:gephyrin-like molybdotransferase Glp [Aceticella autotrophica]QSZ26883.1 molybdopterin molybdotransferase MoeA [Aceticella autotrophica]